MFQSSQLEEKLRNHFRERIKIDSGNKIHAIKTGKQKDEILHSKYVNTY